MIAESYVSFDTAKLLKEAGFNVPCEKWYGESGFFMSGNYKECKCPTQALAARWLRDIYNLHISTAPYAGTWHWVLWNVNGTFITSSATRGKEGFETCEEAIEDALCEAIKLVK